MLGLDSRLPLLLLQPATLLIPFVAHQRDRALHPAVPVHELAESALPLVEGDFVVADRHVVLLIETRMLLVRRQTDEVLLTVVFEAFVLGVVIVAEIVPRVEHQSVCGFEVVGGLSTDSIQLLWEALHSGWPSPGVLIVDELHQAALLSLTVAFGFRHGEIKLSIFYANLSLFNHSLLGHFPSKGSVPSSHTMHPFSVQL